MDRPFEFRLNLFRDSGQEVIVSLYGVTDAGAMSYLDGECFGPLDTCTDILRWAVRRLSPLMELPYR